MITRAWRSPVKLINRQRGQRYQARNGFIATVVMDSHATAHAERRSSVVKRVVLTQTPSVKRVRAHCRPGLLLR